MAQLEDKELHLNELRNQLRDLEIMVSSIKNMDKQDLLLRQKEFNDGCEREKQKLIDNHEVSRRVRFKLN